MGCKPKLITTHCTGTVVRILEGFLRAQTPHFGALTLYVSYKYAIYLTHFFDVLVISLRRGGLIASKWTDICEMMGDASLHTPSRIPESNEKIYEHPYKRLGNPAKDHNRTKVEHDQ